MAITLPVISISSPTTEDTGDVRIRQVPRVPVDVFQEIVPHLQFKDRLNLSLISIDIYTALSPRRTHVAVSTIHQLASFAAYISGDAARAPALCSLHILMDYPLPSENPSALEDAQHNADLILGSAINLEELVCRGDAASDLVPKALTTSRRLSHLALQGLPSILAGKQPSKSFFPLTLRSIHVTRWYPHIIRSLPLAYILGLVCHLPALDTLTVEHHVFPMFMLEDDADSQRPGEESKAIPLPVLPSVRTLKLLGCSRRIVHPAFVPKLAQSLPNLATLHFDRTSLPGWSAEYAVDHLALTNIPCRPESRPVPWRARRLTYVLGDGADRIDFSIPHCRVDLSTVLCLSISAPIIAARIWDDLTANSWDTRLLELESTVANFSELVAPLIDRPATDSTADVPLTCISIATHELGIPWDSEGTWERVRSEFLQRASTYFPSLRYVALATPHWPAYIAPIPAYPGDDVPVWTWWRIHRVSEDAPVEIREIPVWEGRRVREFLRDADAEAVDDFDRTCLQSF
ncbi:hypothetical protein V8D89_003916 [Ganoderma adspersum]